MPTRACPNGHKVKDSKALKCPQCGEDLPPVKKRSKAPLIVGIVALLLICAIIAIATGGNKGDKQVAAPTTAPQAAQVATTSASKGTAATVEQPKPTAKPTDKPKPTAEPPATPVPEKPTVLGDVVQNGGYFLCALQMVDPAKAGMFYQAEAGKKLVAVEVIVGNVSGKQENVNPLNASLVDADGFTYSLELAGVDDQLATVAVAPGEKVRGWVAFKIPDNAKPAYLKYGMSLFSSKPLQAGLGGEPVSELGDIEALGTLPDAPGLNQAIEEDGAMLMATGVEDPAPGGILYKSVDGRKLVAVEIVVGNQTLEKVEVNPLYASLVDTDGFVYDLELAGRDGQLDTVTLAKGEKAKGWVAFDIPQSAKVYMVRYETDVLLQGKLLRVKLAQ